MVRVENLSKVFRDVIALSSVSFEIDEGIAILVGPNGAGKTTTLRCISGSLRPDSGYVEIFGKRPNEVKERMAFLSESRRSFRKMKVEDYEELLPLLYPRWNARLFREFLAHFSIERSRRIDELSAGMKTLFHLSVVLSSGADLMLLDEPTQNLDPVKVSEFEKILRDISKEKIVLISTHHVEEVESLADRMIVIVGGKVIYEADVDEAKDTHRIVPASLIEDGDEVIEKVDGEFLVRTEDDKGRYPKLREIVLAYLKRGSNFSWYNGGSGIS